VRADPQRLPVAAGDGQGRPVRPLQTPARRRWAQSAAGARQAFSSTRCPRRQLVGDVPGRRRPGGAALWRPWPCPATRSRRRRARPRASESDAMIRLRDLEVLRDGPGCRAEVAEWPARAKTALNCWSCWRVDHVPASAQHGDGGPRIAWAAVWPRVVPPGRPRRRSRRPSRPGPRPKEAGETQAVLSLSGRGEPDDGTPGRPRRSSALRAAAGIPAPPAAAATPAGRGRDTRGPPAPPSPGSARPASPGPPPAGTRRGPCRVRYGANLSLGAAGLAERDDGLGIRSRVLGPIPSMLKKASAARSSAVNGPADGGSAAWSAAA
jgi:hypothetical protein